MIEGIHYIEHHVLQVPFFLMSFMRYLSPAMDHMFMDSLAWVDQTYFAKHSGENPDDLRATYYPNLRMYDNVHVEKEKIQGQKKSKKEAMAAFFWRFGKKATLSLGVYFASFLPVVGRFVLPAASFYTFNKGVGTPAAVVIFGSGLVLPKRYLVMFLQSYFSSRSLMRELVRIVQPQAKPNVELAILIRLYSSNPTSPASTTQNPKRNSGSTTARASFMASPSPSSSSSEYPWSESSYTALLRHPRRILSRRLRSRRLHLQM